MVVYGNIISIEEEETMYSGFDLSVSSEFLNEYFTNGKTYYAETKNTIRSDLKEYICSKGTLNGSMIQEDWFPQIKANIFISHSHQDEKLAISFAGWLKEKFGLNAFIDSSVWGYANDLLGILDDEYSVQTRHPDGNVTYDYGMRNYTTSHVHMMLATALSKMIDNAECLIFLNTPNSLIVKDIISTNSTMSPWIYTELLISSIVRHKPLKEYRASDVIEHRAFSESAQMNIKYNVPLDHLIELSEEDLTNWLKQFKSKQYPLDDLYKIKTKDMYRME